MSFNNNYTSYPNEQSSSNYNPSSTTRATSAGKKTREQQPAPLSTDRSEQWKTSETGPPLSGTSSQSSEPIMSTASMYSASASSVRSVGGSIGSASKPLLEEGRRSSIGRVMDKAKAKFSGAERLPSNESEFESEKRKEVEKQRRKEEYERLGLGDRTKFGSPGSGNWSM